MAVGQCSLAQARLVTVLGWHWALQLPSAREEACFPGTLEIGQIAAFFSVLGPSVGPRPSVGSGLSLGRREGDACVSHARVPPISPLLLSLEPGALPSYASAPEPWFGFWSVSCRRAPFSGAVPRCHHCPLWSARMDIGVGLGGWPAGATLLVLRPTRGPGQALPPWPMLELALQWWH